MIAPNTPQLTLEGRREFSGLLRENQQFASGSGSGMSESVNGWFDRLMIQSGMQTSPVVWLGLCLLSGVALGGMTLILSDRRHPLQGSHHPLAVGLRCLPRTMHHRPVPRWRRDFCRSGFARPIHLSLPSRFWADAWTAPRSGAGCAGPGRPPRRCWSGPAPPP